MSNNIIAKIETGTDITVKTLLAGPGVSASIEMKNILDVDNTAEADGRILIYDSASDKHIYIDRFDSASATGLVDSAYVQLRQIKYSTADFTDSAYVTSVLPVFGTDFVDSAYVISVLPTLGNDFVDSAYVTNLPISTFTNDADYLDSTTVTGVINSGYIQTNQITYNTSDFTDSAFVSSSISTAVNNLIDGAPGTLDTINEIAAALNDDDSAVNSLTTLINSKDSDFVKSAADQAWIQSQQITYNTSNFTDSAYVASVLPTLGGDFVDSAYVTSLPISTFSNDADYLDSTTVLGVINQSYIQSNQITYSTNDFTDSAYVQSVLPTLGGDFVDSAYVTSLPVSTFSNDANYLDSTTVTDFIDSAYVQSRQITYSNVSEFANDANYLDSTTVQGVINSSYIQTNQITYNTSDFTDSAYVSGQITTAIDALVDGAPGTLDTLNEIAAALNDDDSAYATLVSLINDQLDSAEAIALIDSAYVQARQITYNTSDFTDSAFVTGLPVSTFNNDTNYLDSTTVTGVIDQTYVQNNQIKYTTADFTDSAYVTSVLPTLGGDYVDSAYVTSLPVSTFSNDANYLDSTTATGFIDSAYVQLRQTPGTDSAAVLALVTSDGFTKYDSTNTIGLIDSAYVQLRQIKYSTADFTDSAYVTSVLPTLGNDFVDSAYVASVLPTLGSDFVDSAYVTGLPVSTFTNDANYLDSTTVTGVINSSYIQTNQITYNTSDFTDSAFVSAQINALIDGAPGTLDTLNEIAAALNDDDSAVNSLTTLINAKDSDFVKSAADQTWIQSQQIKYTTADFTDSAYVTSVLPTLGGDFVDSAYVTSVLPTLGNDFVDSAYVTSLPVSTFTNDANYLDSTTVTDFIDSAYVQLKAPAAYIRTAVEAATNSNVFNDSDHTKLNALSGILTDSAVPPSSPSNGDKWFDDSDGILYMRVADNWIDISTQAVFTDALTLGGNDSDYYRLNVYDSAGVLLN